MIIEKHIHFEDTPVVKLSNEINKFGKIYTTSKVSILVRVFIMLVQNDNESRTKPFLFLVLHYSKG